MRMVLVAGVLMLALFVALISSVGAMSQDGAAAVARTQQAIGSGIAG